EKPRSTRQGSTVRELGGSGVSTFIGTWRGGAGTGWAAHDKPPRNRHARWVPPSKRIHPAWREYLGDSQFVSPGQKAQDEVWNRWKMMTPAEREGETQRLSRIYYGDEGHWSNFG